MNSQILIANTNSFKIYIIDSTEISKKSLIDNLLPEYFSYHISRLLSVFQIIRENSKIKGTKIYLKVKADGLFGNISIKTTGDDSFIVNTNIKREQLEKFTSINDLDEYRKYFSIGNGFLEVTLDYGLKQMYRSNIQILNGNIDEAIVNFYNSSEQIETIVRTSSIFDNDKLIKSGAIFIQAMPNTDPELIEKIKNKLDKIYDVSKLLKEGFTLEKILDLVFEDDDKIFESKNNEKYYIQKYNIQEIKEMIYKCDCSIDNMKDRIKISIPMNEIEEMISEDGKIEVQCNLCNEKYEILEI